MLHNRSARLAVHNLPCRTSTPWKLKPYQGAPAAAGPLPRQRGRLHTPWTQHSAGLKKSPRLNCP
jgi:hypothetical protein